MKTLAERYCAVVRARATDGTCVLSAEMVCKLLTDVEMSTSIDAKLSVIESLIGGASATDVQKQIRAEYEAYKLARMEPPL